MHKDKLYSIALQCARLSTQGCALGCEQCQYNIFNYVDDTREASLLKANAYADHYNSMQVKKEFDSAIVWNQISALLAIGVVILISMWACSSVKSCFLPASAAQIQEVPVPMASPPNHRTDNEGYHTAGQALQGMLLAQQYKPSAAFRLDHLIVVRRSGRDIRFLV